MTTLILDTIARALDPLPLTANQRAEIFHAWDAAPDTDPRDDQTAEPYFRGEAHAAWRRVREIPLNGAEAYLKTTLDEASGFTSCPTKTDLLAALARAERMIAA